MLVQPRSATDLLVSRHRIFLCIFTIKRLFHLEDPRGWNISGTLLVPTQTCWSTFLCGISEFLVEWAKSHRGRRNGRTFSLLATSSPVLGAAGCWGRGPGDGRDRCRRRCQQTFGRRPRLVRRSDDLFETLIKLACDCRDDPLRQAAYVDPLQDVLP